MANKSNKTIALYVQKELRKRKCTQVALANYMGLTKQALTYKFANNQWSLDDMIFVAGFFKMKLYDLVIQSGQR